MRWRFLALIPLIVLLAQTPAWAPWHDLWTRAETTGKISDLNQADRGAAGESLAAAALTAAAETVGVTSTLSSLSSAVFLSVSSVAVMILVGDYVFALVFGTLRAEGAFQLIVLTLLNFIILYGMLVMSGPRLFAGSRRLVNGRITSAQAFRITVVPALLPTLYSLVFR